MDVPPEITQMGHPSPTVAREFARIYEASFPPSESQEVDVLLAAVAAGRCTCYVALGGGSVVGLAVLPDPGEPGIWYLMYLAVAPDVTGRGVGGQLLDHLGRVANSAGASGIGGSVEDPGEVQGEERSMRLRRIEFYRRHRASRVDCAPRFRAPRFDAEGTQPLWVIWLPARDGLSRLEGPVLRRTVHAILTSVCGLPIAHPLVTAVLADLRC